mgnify:CR=1 FL=1
MERFANEAEALKSLERLDYIYSFGPLNSFRSKFGGSRETPYYAFLFNKCIVAECPIEGNAIYVVRDIENWKNF